MRQRHPAKAESRLVYANTGAKVARVVYSPLHEARTYVKKYQGHDTPEIAVGLADTGIPSPVRFSRIRKRVRQFVNYLNHVQAGAPVKFKVAAEAFEKISWL